MSKNTNASKTGFKFDEVCLSFIEKCRFYTVLLSKINKVPLNKIPTAGVGFNKHGKLTMYYNPSFIENLPLTEAQGLIEHECCHIVYRHLTRFPMQGTDVTIVNSGNIKKVLKDAHDNKINNWGTDCAINQYITDLPTYQAGDEAIGQKSLDGTVIKVGDPVGLYPETFDLDRDKAAEYYVEELKKKYPEPPKMPESMKMPCQTCGGTGENPDPQDGDSQDDGQGEEEEKQDAKGKGEGEQEDGEGQGEPCPDCNGTGEQEVPMLDSHDLWGKVIETDEEGNITSIGDVADNPDIDPEMECENVVMKAIKECKDWGKIPAHIAREVERLKAQKRHDWKSTLRVFINSVLTVNKRMTQKRVNRRLSTIVDYLAPGKKKARRPRVLYVRDTSGSMFNDTVQAEIANELEQLAKRCEVFVMDADTEAQKQENGQYHYRFRKYSDLKPYLGGGGTCFIDAFEKAKKIGVDGIIYATDTYGSFPDKKEAGKFGKATIWLTFGQDEVNIPWGRHVNINPDDFKTN
jgi:predicted metal-dependent peptidase